METIDLFRVHQLARSMPYGQFEQELKVMLTGGPYTAVIDCEPVVVDSIGQIYDAQQRYDKAFAWWKATALHTGHYNDALKIAAGLKEVDNV